MIPELYDKKALARNFFWLVVLFAACKFSKGAAFAVLIPITLVFIVQARNTALLATLFVASAAMTMTSFFMPHTVPFVASQKVLMLMAAFFLALQVFGRRHSVLITPLLSIFPYLIYMVFVSQGGWMPAISNLKLFLFTMIYCALYGCAVRVTEDRCDGRNVRTIVLVLGIFYIFGSLVLIPFPGISYMSSEELLRDPTAISLFKGTTNHSQALGPTVAMFSVMLFADLVFSIQRFEPLYMALLAVAPYLILRTSSRTAMGSYLAGMAFVAFFAMNSKGIVKTRWRRAMTNSILMIAVIGSISISVVPPLRDKATKFLLKSYSGETAVSMELIMASRSSVYERTLENWRRKPIVGNGFQVSEEMEGIRIDSIRDILSAPVEKCTWVYAILEEGGVIGMILFSLFLLISIGLMVKRHAYIGASMLITFVMVNLGEFGIFSMSADGGLFWCMVFIGVILDHKRQIAAKRRDEEAFARALAFV